MISADDLASVSATAHTAVVRSAFNAFQTMLATTCVVRPDAPAPAPADTSPKVAGVISWFGSFNGTGVFECSPSCACLIASSLLDTEIASLTEDALDAVAEMANIVFGSMKTELEEQLGPMNLGTPTVIHGSNIAMHNMGTSCSGVVVQFGEHLIRIRLYIAPQRVF